MNGTSTVKYLEADICCYHCGHVTGVLRRACGMSDGPTVFRDHTRGARSVVRRLSDLHCARCDGPVYAEPFEVRRSYPLLDLQAEAERRRRGRLATFAQPAAPSHAASRPGA